MNKRRLTILLVFLFASAFSLSQIYANGMSLPKAGYLPKIFFKDSASIEAMKYLGLSRKKNFSLDDMHGSLFVIEVFNTYCTTCPRNVPVLNDVYAAVEKNAEEKRTIKVFGIAIGNTEKEAGDYKTRHNVLFPVLTDYDFSIHSTLGNPRVPYTLYLKKTAKGYLVVDTHQGVLDSAVAFLEKVRMLN